MILRIAIAPLGLGLLLVGFTGLLRPTDLAEALELAPGTAVGVGSVRAMIGAHYLAMGATALYAAVRGRGAWLAPLAAIEGCMVLARILSAVSGELDAGGVTATGVEIVACIVFAFGSVTLRRPLGRP
jgi:hypothetical protein